MPETPGSTPHGSTAHGSSTEQGGGAPQGRHSAAGDERVEAPVSHGGHGTSVAAWVSVALILLGALVVAISMIFYSLTFIIAGAVVMVVGAVAGPVLTRAGFGEDAPNREYTGGPRAVR